MVDKTQNAQCRIAQRSKRFGRTGPLGVVTVFVPPAILDEVDEQIIAAAFERGDGSSL
jgi:hypothetical protein